MKQYDWVKWHSMYDAPGSELARRLEIVQSHIRDTLDRAPQGLFTVVSVCSGQGRDLLPVLASHPRRGDVRAHLIELDPHNAEIARATAAELGLSEVTVGAGDAGVTDAYVGAVPADLVIMCGLFRHISKRDVARTIKVTRGLCADNATVMWTRDRRPPDFTRTVRRWFRRAGFVEVAFDAPADAWFAVGVERFADTPVPLRTGVRLFTFGSSARRPHWLRVRRFIRRMPRVHALATRLRAAVRSRP